MGKMKKKKKRLLQEKVQSILLQRMMERMK